MKTKMIIAALGVILLILLILGFYFGIAYIIVHFIRKWW